MSAQKTGWTPRLVVSRPVGESTGRVLAVQCGVVHVASRGRRLRATAGAELLAEMTRDPAAGPRPGDRVRLRLWPDGPVTVERVLARAVTRGEAPGDLLG